MAADVVKLFITGNGMKSTKKPIKQYHYEIYDNFASRDFKDSKNSPSKFKFVRMSLFILYILRKAIECDQF